MKYAHVEIDEIYKVTYIIDNMGEMEKKYMKDWIMKQIENKKSIKITINNVSIPKINNK